MMSSRYRNILRRSWPRSINDERWQPRSNVYSFGYRRHELPSTSTFREGTSEEVPAYGESYNDTCFRREPRDRFQSQNSYEADSRESEPYCAPSNARRRVTTEYEIHDLVKAASGTDFRFSLHSSDEEQSQFPNRNPYRTVPTTAQEQRPLVPILKNTSNPWKAEGGINDATRRSLAFAQTRGANRGSPTSGPLQRAPNAGSPPSKGSLPVPPNLVWSWTAQDNSCPDSITVWDTPPTLAQGNRGYFEALRWRGQERNMSGKSHWPGSLFEQEQPAVNSGPPQTLAFASSSNAPMFSNYSNRDGNAQPSQNATGPGGGHHAGIQGTWRGRTAGKGKSSNRGRGTWSGRQPTPNCRPHGRVNGTGVGGPKGAGSRMTRCGVSDARFVLDRKRKYAASEEDSTESIQPREEQPAVGTPTGSTQLSSKVALMERVQHDVKLSVENNFSENDPAPSYSLDVHEVDESQLWPPGVNPEAVSYVIFLNIDRRSFFDEAKQPFLPGTLLYLFYGDLSMLLPTRKHLFYKDFKGNWVHFYPDCGTEYGSYLVAAPAVISWMDQKVPQRVKFLVHGHQKQLNLDGMSRKILFYPTSRTVDVPLLNRMLRGDFDAPKPQKTAAPTAIKTITIRNTTAAPAPAAKGKVSPNLANRNAPVRAPQLPLLQAPCSDSSLSDHAPPAFAAKSPARVQKHHPILAPGQQAFGKEQATRQKICWDL